MDLRSKRYITDLTKFFARKRGIESTRSKAYRGIRHDSLFAFLPGHNRPRSDSDIGD
jgi:hypothetical protein